jgi:hypothetical protein
VIYEVYGLLASTFSMSLTEFERLPIERLKFLTHEANRYMPKFRSR